jgi:segregation and condensation protein B
MNDAIEQDLDHKVDQDIESLDYDSPVTDAPAEPIDQEKLKQIVEGLLMAAGKPLSVNDISALFLEQERPEDSELKEALVSIAADCEGKGFELKEVASGFRFQVRRQLSPWVSRLWEERPQRYTRALLETLALIAYRQPITRGDIEEIRGVGVSSTIIRTLLDREWIRVVGHRDVPGRPAMFATTRQFLDYFDLKSLQDLPPLSDIRDLDQLNRELELEDVMGDMRVLELPSEEETAAADEDAEFTAEQGEYPDEEEAMALAKKPLDEILGIKPATTEETQEKDDSDR